jgi:CubicO group peptidase (beta-lactamase class C family)
MMTKVHTSASILIGFILIGICAISLECTGFAQEPAVMADEEATGKFASNTELEAFFDGILSVQRDIYRLAGMTISVVHGGEIIFAKGYGSADIEADKPVEADRTLFRPGSVSKLFTWTAVMQLVEQGKLDLDTDVNTYFTDFEIPATYPEPITLSHILTHTPGLEDGAVGYLFVKSEDELKPLGQALSEHIPARVRPPGQLGSYSNWATALAGHIVATVSGQPFDEYVEENIFKPLGMTHSTFREPLPADLADDMSVGYSLKDGWYESQGFEYIHNFGPAGGLASTAVDMAKFMIAHLQNGRYGEAWILSTESSQRMQSRLFTHHEGVAGMAHGFYEINNNGRRLIGHGGDTGWFHTLLALLPEENVGLFVSTNTAGAPVRTAGFRDALLDAFMDKYYPTTEAPRKELAELDTAPFTGKYRVARHSYTKIEKLSVLLSGDIEVTAGEKGRLKLVSPLGTELFRPMDENVFQQVGADTRVAFRLDDNGSATHLFFDPAPMIGMYKLSWYQTASFHQVLGVVCVLLFVGRLWGTFRRRKLPNADKPKARLASRILTLSTLLNALFLICVFVVFGSMDISQLLYGWPDGLSAVLALAVLGALLALGALVMTFWVWKGGFWTFWARTRYTVVMLAAIAFAWSLNYWNALGWYL